ncbi:MAG: hypothetical protein FJW69_04210 [Actinobacteria bacterium]|nr:hypothetical protein [Actinomycetota bacterium]
MLSRNTIFLRFFVFVLIILVSLIYCLFYLGVKTGYAENKNKIVLKGVVSGAGAPNYLGEVSWLSVSGNYAFTVSYEDNWLSIFDVSNPSAPAFISGIEVQGYEGKDYGAFSVFATGDYAFVYDDGGMILIYDVSDPVNKGPILLFKDNLDSKEKYKQAESAWGCVFVSGNYLYTVDEVTDMLAVFDLTNISSPAWVGKISGGGAPNYLKDPISVTVSGNNAYVASTGDDALSIFDISNPKTPAFKGVIKGAGEPNYLGGINSVFIIGNYAYTVSEDDDSLSIIDISSPSNPTLKGVIRGGGKPNYLDSASDVVVVNNYAFTASPFDNAIAVFDVIDPSSPEIVDVISGAGSPNYLKAVDSLAVSGNYLYATAYIDNALSIYDISSFVSEKRTGGETAIDNGEDGEEAVIPADDGEASVLRQWLRQNNPYSI